MVKEAIPVLVMLVDNKSDKWIKRVVLVKKRSALTKELRCKFVKVLVKNCLNVKKIFYNMV